MEEVERVCYESELARAEAYTNAQDEEPDAEECLANCVHADACRRMFEHYAFAVDTDEARMLMAMEIGCEECEEYEDQWCPMSLSGTMRCQGPRRSERKVGR